MENINVQELVERLGSDEDGIRKMAAFRLQSNIGDPSFADLFILEGGIIKLRQLVLRAHGNTLAYSLTSFARLLEVDKGWDYVNQELVYRVVELVVEHPLVNILRGAMSILVHIVSYSHTSISPVAQLDNVGFGALKPAIAVHPQFLEMLVSRLSSADHALCANALQLINSLMREAITNEEDSWPKFIRRLQDLGVIEAVFGLMQGTAIQDLSQPLQEFQTLTRVLLRKWMDMSVDLERPDHRRALKTVHAASAPEKPAQASEEGNKKSHNPQKWRRLGFGSESPAYEFEETGYLGMMDLADYVRKHEEAFQRQLLEQTNVPPARRCPIARASLAVTSILIEQFEIAQADVNDAKFQLAFESRTNFDQIFKPLLLQWSIMHITGLQAFFRLWQATKAEIEDFHRIKDLVRVLLGAVLKTAPRTKTVLEAQKDIEEFELSKLRQIQMQVLELTYEDTWGRQLRQIKDELAHEAIQFVKEQRIRCLLAGSWFPHGPSIINDVGLEGLSHAKAYRYAKLSHNRRYLHFSDFDVRGNTEHPSLENLSEKVDLSQVTSVTSNVTAAPIPSALPSANPKMTANTTITIYGRAPGQGSTQRSQTSQSQQESELLVLHPPNKTLASEWLDGLLMLLNQQPITNETAKLMDLIKDYGLKIRLLNVRFDEMDPNGRREGPQLPSREGVDEDFWYEDFGA